MMGESFWKVEDSHAMLPPNIVKQVGRPKSKRNREPNKARKRKGEWSQAKKGTQMTYSNYDEPNHNAKGEEDDLEQIQVATQNFEPYGPDVGNEEDPPLRLMVYPESESWVEKLMTRGVPTGEGWIHVPPIKRALVINIRDVLQIMSNDRYKSDEHHAIVSANRNRVSVPIFVNPVPDAIFGPLKQVLKMERNHCINKLFTQIISIISSVKVTRASKQLNLLKYDKFVDSTLDYIESKTLAEKEMLNFGKEGLEVLTLCCGLVGGHTYLHYTPTTLAMFLSILTRGEFLLYTQVEDDRDEDVEMDM
ncbi:hypothetical protein FXO37_27760 [Capsicum annuum]|nr:hypothetical protein FXO37_27760 [Capsicum annuum]